MAPLLIAVPGLALVWDAVMRSSWATLGRDQGIFQYVAWAVSKGDVAYRDVRDVNGPIVMMVHGLFLALGGSDEHRFRLLDLLFTSASYLTAGALLPKLVERPRPGHAFWALAAWTVLIAQYLAYGFWDTAQRESFLDWFVLVAIALGVARKHRASGFFSLLPLFGKPTYALFTIAQVVALLLEPGTIRERIRGVKPFAIGGVFGLLLPFAHLVIKGDVGAWARITFVDVPTMYRFIWPSPASVILSWYRNNAIYAPLTTIAVSSLILAGRLPRRALPIALLPVLGLASVIIQGKGFPYHFHPVTLGIGYGWLAIAYALWEGETKARWLTIGRHIVSLAVCGVLSWKTFAIARTSPYPLAREPAIDLYERYDFYPRALREAATYLREHTGPDDRVQMYSMDAYVLFLAERRSATPYLYAYDLNVDAALHGSFAEDGLKPTAEQQERIRALRDRSAADFLARMQKAPPAAFVFVDSSPLMNTTDATADFAAHCPDANAWLLEHYEPVADFNVVHVWMPMKP